MSALSDESFVSLKTVTHGIQKVSFTGSKKSSLIFGLKAAYFCIYTVVELVFITYTKVIQVKQKGIKTTQSVQSHGGVLTLFTTHSLRDLFWPQLSVVA